MQSLIDFFVPKRILSERRFLARYRAVVRTLLAVSAMAAIFLPLYVIFVQKALLDTVVIVGCILTPFIGAFIIRHTGSLTGGLAIASLFGVFFGGIFAFYTGGIQSFTLPWFLSNLALLGTFGDRRLLIFVSASVFITFSFLIFADIAGWLPHMALSNEDRMIGFAISSLTAAGAVTWGAYIVDKARDRAKRRLKDALAKAETANAAKSQFLATMSHEIRTPLTGVLGIADLLGETELSSAQQKQVKTIKDSGRFLLSILNDILDFSRIESDQIELGAIDFRLRDIIEETLALVRGKPEAEGLAFALNIDEATPEGVNGDPARLRQILLNLLGNAVKFTPMGTVSVSVAPKEVDHRGYGMEFRIEDTGIGMSQQEIQRLFKPFTQADSSISRRYGGSGLGLAICKRLVELMGGEIRVESRLEGGSTFIFTAFFAPLINPLADKTDDEKHRTFEATRPLDILIAEDSPLNQAIISQILRKLGHRVELAENGEEAVEAVEQSFFDLVVMDVRMPVISGPEATRIIRAMPPPKGIIPIVGCTADAVPEHIAEFKKDGMNGVVIKPFRKSDLLYAINRAVDEEIHLSTGIDEPGSQSAGPSKNKGTDMAVDSLLDRMNEI